MSGPLRPSDRSQDRGQSAIPTVDAPLGPRHDAAYCEDAEEILETAPCGFLSTRPDGTILRANRTIADWVQQPREALVGGQKFQDLMTVPGRIFYETHFSPLLRMQGFVKEIACQLKRNGQTPLDVIVNSTLKLGSDGTPLIIRTAVFDATDRVKYEHELRRSRNHAQQFAAIVTSSQDAIISVGSDDIVLTWNPGAASMFGWTENEAIGRAINDLIMPAAMRDSAAPGYARVAASDTGMPEQTVRRRRDGSQIDVELNVSPIVGADGRSSAISVIFRDIRERKRAEGHIKLLMAEVNHRAKNLLGVVQAIVNQTSRSGDPATFAKRLSDRVAALAANQDLLVKTEWQFVDLRELIVVQLDHFADLIGQRLIIDGPILRLNPAAAQGIGLAVHELATNAGKYGALSNATGRVHIGWCVDACRSLLTMTWCETGGPRVEAPTRRGFGMTVTGRLVEGAVQGEVETRFDPTGLLWTLRAPLESIVERGLNEILILDDEAQFQGPAAASA